MTEVKNIPATLQPKIDELARLTAAKAKEICKRHNIPADATDALIADATELLNGKYSGLHATIEQMRCLSDGIKRRTWDKVDNAALGLITMYYRDIVSMVEGARIVMPSTNAFINLWAVSLYETRRRTKEQQPLDIGSDYVAGRMGGAPVYDDEQLKEQAQRLYYIYSVQIVGERTDATREELEAIEPLCPVPDTAKARGIDMALDMRRQRAQVEDYNRTHRRGKKESNEPQPTLPLAEERLIKLQAAYIDTAAGGMIVRGKDSSDTYTPLRLQIENLKTNAEATLQNPYATDEAKRRAQGLIASMGYVMQVYNILPVILYDVPQSADTEYYKYKFSAHEFTKLCTDVDKPNNVQIANTMRAAYLLSSLRVQVKEWAEPKRGKGEPICYVTDFQPIVVKFSAKYEKDAIIDNSTTIQLNIDRLISEGRTTEVHEEIDAAGKKRTYYVKRRPALLIPEKHYTAFSGNDEEINFRNIILNNAGKKEGTKRICRKNEYEMLSAVFDYTGRQAVLDRRAQAEPENRKAKQAAKTQITNHMGRDVEKLNALFLKAMNVGLIETYDREAAKGKKAAGKYGRGYVRIWTRKLGTSNEKP